VTNLRESVQSALESVQIDPRDEGVRALLLRYAELMDEPGVPAKYVKHLKVLGSLVRREGTADQVLAMTALEAALSEQTVTSDLGPKLLAGLQSMGLTLAARGEKGRDTGAPDPALTAHDELRARRRAHGA
jgi:hypothetical protein